MSRILDRALILAALLMLLLMWQESEAQEGKRMLKEVEYQIFENPSWSVAEREWFNTLRNNFLGCVESYEMEAQEAYLRGVEYADSMMNGFDQSA
jgi:hypothetical protein